VQHVSCLVNLDALRWSTTIEKVKRVHVDRLGEVKDGLEAWTEGSRSRGWTMDG
jgi:hypothetical protein